MNYSFLQVITYHKLIINFAFVKYLGISFVKKNIWKLEDASDAHMTCGFEVVFPALLGRARELGIDDLPYDIPILRKINAARDKKWKRYV